MEANYRERLGAEVDARLAAGGSAGGAAPLAAGGESGCKTWCTPSTSHILVPLPAEPAKKGRGRGGKDAEAGKRASEEAAAAAREESLQADLQAADSAAAEATQRAEHAEQRTEAVEAGARAALSKLEALLAEAGEERGQGGALLQRQQQEEGPAARLVTMCERVGAKLLALTRQLEEAQEQTAAAAAQQAAAELAESNARADVGALREELEAQRLHAAAAVEAAVRGAQVAAAELLKEELTQAEVGAQAWRAGQACARAHESGSPSNALTCRGGLPGPCRPTRAWSWRCWRSSWTARARTMPPCVRAWTPQWPRSRAPPRPRRRCCTRWHRWVASECAGLRAAHENACSHGAVGHGRCRLVRLATGAARGARRMMWRWRVHGWRLRPTSELRQRQQAARRARV